MKNSITDKEVVLTKEVKEAIDGRHFGNARGCLVDITNNTHNLLMWVMDDKAKEQIEQMKTDRKAIEEFFDKERNFIPKASIEMDYMKKKL